jgi:hypothetical protein
MIEVKALKNLIHGGIVHAKGAVLELEDHVAKQLHKEGSVESTDGSMPNVNPTPETPAVMPDAEVQDNAVSTKPGDVEEGGSEDATKAAGVNQPKADADGIEAGGAEQQ